MHAPSRTIQSLDVGALSSTPGLRFKASKSERRLDGVVTPLDDVHSFQRLGFLGAGIDTMALTFNAGGFALEDKVIDHR